MSLTNLRMEEPGRHNWLYSVVPQFNGVNIYLAGFCPKCRNSFTVRLKTQELAGKVLMNKLDVPTTGCEPVE